MKVKGSGVYSLVWGVLCYFSSSIFMTLFLFIKTFHVDVLTSQTSIQYYSLKCLEEGGGLLFSVNFMGVYYVTTVHVWLIHIFSPAIFFICSPSLKPVLRGFYLCFPSPTDYSSQNKVKLLTGHRLHWSYRCPAVGCFV